MVASSHSGNKVPAKHISWQQAAGAQGAGAGPDMSGFTGAGPDMGQAAGGSDDAPDDVVDGDFREV